MATFDAEEIILPDPFVETLGYASPPIVEMFPVGGAADLTPPVVTLISPPNLSALSPTDSIIIEVTDDVGLGHVEIRIKLGSTPSTETVFNGTSFLGLFAGVSSKVAIVNGWRYTLQRVGGWPSSVTVTVDAFDTSGNKFV